MAVVDLLHWTAGTGWIVLSGGADAGGELRSLALRRAKAQGGVAYLGFNEFSADDVMDDMDDLGAPTGYLVNVVAEDDDTIREQLLDASIIVLEDSVTPDEWRSSLIGVALEAMQDALERGAVILAEGSGAAALGSYIVAEGHFAGGLGWLQHALILPGVTSLSAAPAAQALLDSDPKAIIVGIGEGSALVLGGGGQIEVWGERQVVLAPGRDYLT